MVMNNNATYDTDNSPHSINGPVAQRRECSLAFTLFSEKTGKVEGKRAEMGEAFGGFRDVLNPHSGAAPQISRCCVSSINEMLKGND